MRRSLLVGSALAVVAGVTVAGVHSLAGTGGGDACSARTTTTSVGRWAIRDLGTLGGEGSWANRINERGQVVGAAYTAALDADGDETSHAYLWENGKMCDLGTLGGPDSVATAINDHGQIVGHADTESMGSYGVPVSHAFLWQDGEMRDLGVIGWASDINERGQIVGDMDTKMRYATGDPVKHAFVWQSGRIRDLGTLGGPASHASGINDLGQVVGAADTRESNKLGSLEHAVLWQNGEMTDLGTLPGWQSSSALAINNKGLVVGVSYTDDQDPDSTEVDPHTIGNGTVFAWQNGEMQDLHVPLGEWYEPGEAPMAVSDNGRIVVVVGDRRLVVQNGKIIPLPRLPGDDCDGDAQINGRAQIIGSCGDRAVLWTETG